MTSVRIQDPNLGPAADQPPPDGGKPKKQKLTKEEKKALKAEKKRLKILAEIERKRQLKRDQLNRELAYTKLTYQKQSQEWMEMLESNFGNKIKNELKELMQDVNHIIDTKDNLIEKLLRMRDDSEDSYLRNLEGHYRIFQYIEDTQQLLCDSLRHAYDLEAGELANDFHKFLNNVEDSTMNFEETVGTKMLAKNLLVDNFYVGEYAKFVSEIDTIRNTAIEHRSEMLDGVLEKMNMYQEQIKKLIASLEEEQLSEQRLQDYKIFLQKINDDNLEFNENMANRKNAEKEIHNLSRIITRYDEKFTQKLHDLRSERNFFERIYWELKIKYDDMVKSDKIRIGTLSMKTKKIIEWLNKCDNKGRLIIKLTEVIRKYMTEKEKVSPTLDLPSSMQLEDTDQQLEYVNLDALPKINIHLENMNYFWYKVNMVEQHNCELSEEKNFLLSNNNSLCEVIRKYCHLKSYSVAIDSLEISNTETVIIPVQEAALMPRLFKNKRTVRKTCKKGW